jgi:hypothetical protein
VLSSASGDTLCYPVWFAARLQNKSKVPQDCFILCALSISNPD